jgi:hypothetical protein
MAHTIQKIDVVLGERKMRVFYEQRSILLGLIKYWREAKAEYADDDLHITILNPEQYRKITVNGKYLE